MKIRNLKVAVSAASVLACVLFIALWVRSYWTQDSVTWNVGRKAAVSSRHGQNRMSTSNRTVAGAPLLRWKTGGMMPDNLRNWTFHVYRDGTFAIVPHWLPIALLVLVAVAPWIHWRYSLRALLIAITVVALVLSLLFSF